MKHQISIIKMKTNQRNSVSPASGDLLSSLPQPPILSEPVVEFSEQEYMDALCINCHEMIKVDLIEEHSHLCIQVTHDVKQFELMGEE
jgi:hypothetical protein